MRTGPTRIVETTEQCPYCGAWVRQHEVGFTAGAEPELTWLVATRVCSLGCVLDERKVG
jgi:hypothetical protein